MKINAYDSRISLDYNTAWLLCLTMVHDGYKDWRLPTWNEYLNSGNLNNCWYEDDFYTVYIEKNVIAVRTTEAPL